MVKIVKESSFSDDYEGPIFTDVVLRFSGEIGIKSDPTRKIWERAVIGQVSSRIGEDLEWKLGRGFVRLRSSKLEELVNILTRCFGLSSFSPAIACSHTLKDMEKKAKELVAYYMKKQKINSFGIVIDKNLSDIDRRKIKVETGAAIEDMFSLEVDLDDPDLAVAFDIRKEKGYVYAERVSGAGGLPNRVQGKIVSLLSGGPDSTLAMFLAAKRGCEPIPVFFEFGKERLRKKAKKQAVNVAKSFYERWLSHHGRMYIVPFVEIVNKIIEKGQLQFAHLHLRRFMFQTAELIADKENAKAVVTGEVIGEKSSQTLHNLAITSHVATEYPLLRPLAGTDKQEIFDRLADLDNKLRSLTNSSVEPCTLMTSTHPSTKADLQAVQQSEKRINIDQKQLENLVEQSNILSL